MDSYNSWSSAMAPFTRHHVLEVHPCCSVCPLLWLSHRPLQGQTTVCLPFLSWCTSTLSPLRSQYAHLCLAPIPERVVSLHTASPVPQAVRAGQPRPQGTGYIFPTDPRETHPGVLGQRKKGRAPSSHRPVFSPFLSSEDRTWQP